jgi:ABC-2 type transport system permease protein
MMTIILRKEVRSQFSSPQIYVLAAFFIFLMGWIFINTLNLTKETDVISLSAAVIRPIFSNMSFLFIFIIPAITMRSFSEELKERTLDLLLLSKAKTYEIVIAKFLSSFAAVLLMIALTLIFPVILYLCGYSDWPIIISSYLGTILCSLSYVALGIFISSLTQNQIISAVVTFCLLVTFMLLAQGKVIFSNFFVAKFFEYLGIGTHFGPFTVGILASIDFVYFFTFYAFFLYLTCLSIESKTW